MGMGEMRVGMIRQNLEILNMTLRIKGKKSDTEDSYELEITPKQLSQVTPGEEVLKLSKKKPIKIMAGAPEGEPVPAQTKVKTVHEPLNKESG